MVVSQLVFSNCLSLCLFSKSLISSIGKITTHVRAKKWVTLAVASLAFLTPARAHLTQDLETNGKDPESISLNEGLNLGGWFFDPLQRSGSSGLFVDSLTPTRNLDLSVSTHLPYLSPLKSSIAPSTGSSMLTREETKSFTLNSAEPNPASLWLFDSSNIPSEAYINISEAFPSTSTLTLLSLAALGLASHLVRRRRRR